MSGDEGIDEYFKFLDIPCFALLQGWHIEKDKEDLLVSTSIPRIAFPIESIEQEYFLGRRGENAQEPPHPNLIHLSSSKQISRQHASLKFDKLTQRWTMKVLSKNGIMVRSCFFLSQKNKRREN
jgi:hypothetical protein